MRSQRLMDCRAVIEIRDLIDEVEIEKTGLHEVLKRSGTVAVLELQQAKIQVQLRALVNPERQPIHFFGVIETTDHSIETGNGHVHIGICRRNGQASAYFSIR